VSFRSIKRTLLIIDDDQLLCDAVSQYFSGDEIEVITAHTGSEGINICVKRTVDVVLLDQKLPDTKGINLCTSILSHNDQAKIIFITAYPSFDNAVEAIKVGAYDYLSKPFELEELDLAINKSLRTLELERVEQIQAYKNNKESGETVLVGSQSGLSGIWKMVGVAASVNSPVLITGETGVGKNVVAKAIHYKSLARRSAFIGINCASLPENLIESELFGFEKGAFTGAAASNKGIFEMAEGGTLFLDEIGNLPLHLQSKLLGVLDDKKIKRLGGQSIRSVNVRIIAATNRDIENAIKDGTFRKDLYYRLSVIRIHIPPLRERDRDIPELCNHFIQKIAGASKIALPDSEIEGLMNYDWPGNVRELRNIIERSIILRESPVIRPSELLSKKNTAISSALSQNQMNGNVATLEEMEKDHIKFSLNNLQNNHTRTAEALGISRSTLMRKIKAYGLG